MATARYFIWNWYHRHKVHVFFPPLYIDIDYCTFATWWSRYFAVIMSNILTKKAEFHLLNKLFILTQSCISITFTRYSYASLTGTSHSWFQRIIIVPPPGCKMKRKLDRFFPCCQVFEEAQCHNDALKTLHCWCLATKFGANLMITKAFGLCRLPCVLFSILHFCVIRGP